MCSACGRRGLQRGAWTGQERAGEREGDAHLILCSGGVRDASGPCPGFLPRCRPRSSDPITRRQFPPPGKLVITRERPGWRGPRRRPQGSPRVRAEGAFSYLLLPSRGLARGHSASNRLRDLTKTFYKHVISRRNTYTIIFASRRRAAARILSSWTSARMATFSLSFEPAPYG